MMQNILIGNGINIQFGGRAYTSNFIMKRIKYRAILGNYDGLFGEEITANEIVKLLDGFVDEANQIIEGHYDEYIDNTETAEAVQDFKNRYSSKIENSHDIMLEDWFLVVHIFFLKNIDLMEHRISAIQGFEHLILDAIFNGGNIQKIHLKMGINKKVRKFFKRFDNIFTLNYDNNIENLTGNIVYHLHGDFSVLTNSENVNNVLGYIRNEEGKLVHSREMSHCFCNALLNYSGRLKRKKINDNHQLILNAESFEQQYSTDLEFRLQLEMLKTEKPLEYKFIMTKIQHPELNIATEYFLDKFKSIEGELTIIGMSPNNDAHIFDAILNNKKLTKVVFYYFDVQDRTYIESNFSRELFKCEQIHSLWASLNCVEPKVNCNYPMPANVVQFVELFNQLSGDKITSRMVIDNVNQTSQYEMIRLCKLVKDDILRRNPSLSSTIEKEFIQQSASISHIALQEGIFPSALFLMCVMNFKYIKD